MVSSTRPAGLLKSHWNQKITNALDSGLQPKPGLAAGAFAVESCL
jgi:hypothetical protein